MGHRVQFQQGAWPFWDGLCRAELLLFPSKPSRKQRLVTQNVPALDAICLRDGFLSGVEGPGKAEQAQSEAGRKLEFLSPFG